MLCLSVGCGIHSSLINTCWVERTSLPSPSIYFTEVVSEKKHNYVISFNWDVLDHVRKSFFPDEYMLVVDALLKDMRNYQGGLGPNGKQKTERCHHPPGKNYNSILFRPPGPRDC